MSDTRERALEGWMAAIAELGWRKADVQAASRLSGLGAQVIVAALGDKVSALAYLQDKVAAQSAQGAGRATAQGLMVREALFDGLMEGFDVFAAHRNAVLSIWNSRDPGVPVLLLGRYGLHVRALALAAGVDVTGVRGRLRLTALAGLIWQAFAAWRQDETADMSGVMAALDRLLDKAEQAETRGISPDLIGLPGLSAFTGFLTRWTKAATGDPAPRP